MREGREQVRADDSVEITHRQQRDQSLRQGPAAQPVASAEGNNAQEYRQHYAKALAPITSTFSDNARGKALQRGDGTPSAVSGTRLVRLNSTAISVSPHSAAIRCRSIGSSAVR